MNLILSLLLPHDSLSLKPHLLSCIYTYLQNRGDYLRIDRERFFSPPYKFRVQNYPVFFLTEHHAMKAYWGCGGTSSRILDLGTRWRWVFRFPPLPLYPQGKCP